MLKKRIQTMDKLSTKVRLPHPIYADLARRCMTSKIPIGSSKYTYLPPMRYFELKQQGVGADAPDRRKINAASRKPSTRRCRVSCSPLLRMGSSRVVHLSSSLKDEACTGVGCKMPFFALGYSQTQGTGVEAIPPVVNNPRFPTDAGRSLRFLNGCQANYETRSMAYVR